MTIWKDPPRWPDDLPPQVGVLADGPFDGAEFYLLEGIPTMYVVPEARLAAWAEYAHGNQSVDLHHFYEVGRCQGWPSRDDRGRIVYRWVRSEERP